VGAGWAALIVPSYCCKFHRVRQSISCNVTHICDPLQWVYYGYGSAMYQQVSNAGTEYKHWNLWGDLVATSSPTGAYSPAPLIDAFGDLFAGARRA